MKYIVTCTKVLNGTIEIEASSKDDAVKKAQERLDSVDWQRGESTADYAEEVPDIKTYYVGYRYCGCSNTFKKDIPAECLAEAVHDAKEWIEQQNATIGDCPKVGNYIDIAVVRDWTGKEKDVIKF